MECSFTTTKGRARNTHLGVAGPPSKAMALRRRLRHLAFHEKMTVTRIDGTWPVQVLRLTAMTFAQLCRHPVEMWSGIGQGMASRLVTANRVAAVGSRAIRRMAGLNGPAHTFVRLADYSPGAAGNVTHNCRLWTITSFIIHYLRWERGGRCSEF